MGGCSVSEDWLRFSSKSLSFLGLEPSWGPVPHAEAAKCVVILQVAARRQVFTILGTPWHKRFGHLLGPACNQPVAKSGRIALLQSAATFLDEPDGERTRPAGDDACNADCVKFGSKLLF